jgi:tetratricopeptide (TPR) repeat protein
MYNTWKAERRHDKIYALLGMSYEDPQTTDHFLKYSTPWSEVFKLLVQFLLPKGISIEVYHDSEIAVITGKGYVLGQVWSVERDPDHYDRRRVAVRFTNSSRSFKDIEDEETCWILQATAKPVHEGDLICVFNGAQKPSIIRLQKDYFVIIAIAATPWQGKRTNSRSKDYLTSHRGLLRQFRLVWDWNNSTYIDSPATTKTQTAITRILPDSDMAVLKGSNFLLNIALILQDGGAYDLAETYLQRVKEKYGETSPLNDHVNLARLENGAFACMKLKNWRRAEELLTRVVEIKQSSHSDTLSSSLADLALVYLARCNSHELRPSMDDILTRIKECTPIREDHFIQLIKSSVIKLLRLLLKLNICTIQITEEVVKAAASNGSHGEEIMRLLLERRGNEVKITEEVVNTAAKNSHAVNLIGTKSYVAPYWIYETL